MLKPNMSWRNIFAVEDKGKALYDDKLLVLFFLEYLTIRLWARDFYEVIVDEAEGRINYRLIEIESE